MAADTLGEQLGQYRILDLLGEGGFGRVFKAVHTLMGRTVAIKVLGPQFADHPAARSWFQREVVTTTRLDHPNIVVAHDANEANGVLYLVVEFVDGLNLETLVRRRGPLALGAACEMLRQCGLALQHAHERGLVHRDIKPANLLVTHSGQVKVADFGLARWLDAPSQGGQSERGFVGSPDYVAPEQARDARSADIRADLYSLGCAFYFALTGQKPFVADTVYEVILKHMQQAPAPLQSLRPEVPDALAAVVHRLMAKEPARRFQTPTELLRELTSLAGAAALASPHRPAAEPVPTVIEVEEPQPLDADFWRRWTQWTNLLTACLNGDDRLHLTESAYRTLHGELLRVSRSRIAAGDDEEQTVFRRLVATLEPWVSWQSLRRTERATLVSLRDNARRLQAALGREGGRGWRTTALLLGVLLALGIGWLLPRIDEAVRQKPLLSLGCGLLALVAGGWSIRRSLRA